MTSRLFCWSLLTLVRAYKGQAAVLSLSTPQVNSKFRNTSNCLALHFDCRLIFIRRVKNHSNLQGLEPSFLNGKSRSQIVAVSRVNSIELKVKRLCWKPEMFFFVEFRESNGPATDKPDFFKQKQTKDRISRTRYSDRDANRDSKTNVFDRKMLKFKPSLKSWFCSVLRLLSDRARYQ